MSKKLSNEKYQEQLNINSPNLELVGDYPGGKQYVTLRCKICGTIFKRYVKPGRHYRCPTCEKKLASPKKTNEEFVKELKEKHPDLLPLTEYKNDNSPILIKCEKCEYTWSVKPTNILHKKGCPRCQGRQKDKKYPKRLIRIRGLMIQRCYNEKTNNFKNYGGRGIKVYQEWIDKPWIFYEWALTHGYANTLTLDRIDNDDDYKPENCRWVSSYVQANNKRTSKKHEYKGEYKTLRDWANELNVDYQKLFNRVYNSGFTIKEALEVPYHVKRENFYKNNTKN